MWSGCSVRCVTRRRCCRREVGTRREYAAHCRRADELTRPLRDCITYYNGHGRLSQEALLIGGGTWHKYRIRAQETLEPYVFDSRGNESEKPCTNPVASQIKGLQGLQVFMQGYGYGRTKFSD